LGIALDFFQIFVKGTYEAGRVSCMNAIVRDVSRNHGPGANDCIGANPGIRQNNDVVAQKAVAPDNDRSNPVKVTGSHDIYHDHRCVMAQNLAPGSNPDVVSDAQQVRIRDIGCLGDKAVFALRVQVTFLFKIPCVRKPTFDKKLEVDL
jgi:hypothetical protein